MKIQARRLIKLFMKIDHLSKRKTIMAQKWRRWRCGFCVSEIVTIYVLFLKRKTRNFGEFYDGVHG
jgi:hypothetical protein